MPSKYRVIQDALNAVGDSPMTDTAVLAWALGRIVDKRAWEVRVAEWGVAIYPVVPSSRRDDK